MERMKYYPVFLNLTGRPCTVVGGGRVAERKVKGLVACEASVTVISPEITPGLAELHSRGELTWVERSYRAGDLAGAFLVIAATDDTEVQVLVHDEAERLGILLNVADVPDLCGFILPATVRRGDLAVSVSTGGKSPALARKLRLELEKKIGPEYRTLVDILGVLRPVVQGAVRPQVENEAMFNELLGRDMAEWIRERAWDKVEGHVRTVLADLATPEVLAKVRAQFDDALFKKNKDNS